MVFDIDPDKPDIPAIARILSTLGLLLLIAAVGLIFAAFSHFVWLNTNYCFIGAVGCFFLAVVLIGQAKTLELLALVSARVKSRFAIERAVMTPAAAAPAPTPSALPTASQKERVISIPESVAREQGVTTRPRAPRDFG
jgi:hypothetical protein